MEQELKELNRKIDLLTDQVTSLTARLQPIDELKEDLVLFTNDAFGEFIRFLSEVDFHFRGEDFVQLLKKMLRNTRNFSKIITQLESTTELFEDLAPLAKDMFNDLVFKFEQFEKEGVFHSLELSLNGIRRLYENFSPEEIEKMGDNHVRLIKLSNKLTTAANLDKLEKIADEIENLNLQEPKRVSLFKILKKARSKEVLQSLDLLLDIAKIVSKNK